MTSPLVIILMGVSGCGKTTVGKALSEKLNVEFIDADDYHTKESVNKMRDGVPLTDKDRVIWLNVLRDIIIKKILEKTTIVLACSALKKDYRDILKTSENVKFFHLAGSKELIKQRVVLRQHLFMSPTLIDSQFSCLEAPLGDECTTINVEVSVDEVVNIIIREIHFKERLKKV